MRGMMRWLVVATLLAAPGAAVPCAAEEAIGGSPAFEVVIEPEVETGAEADKARQGDKAATLHEGGRASEPAAGGPKADAAGEVAAAKGATAKSRAESAAKAAVASAEGRLERVKATFAEFCAGWVDKLRERERHNLAKVEWAAGPDGAVVAEYVGYDTNHVGPQTVDHVDAVPIGKLVYLELKLRRAGKSKEEALAREPEIVERTEVTEIFRFDRSGWVY